MVRLINCNENSAMNFTCVEIGELKLYFSYETCVSILDTKDRIVVSENIWSSTTGKHLSWLDGLEGRT